MVPFLFGLSPLSGAEIVQQSWVQHYSTILSNSYDRALKVALSPGGAIVVTGGTDDGQTGSDFLTIKYGTNGATLWQKRFDGPRHGHDLPVALAVDASGNVIVSGASEGTNGMADICTVKYAAGDGALLWERRFDGLSNGVDTAAAMAVDGAGNVVVSGASVGPSGSLDFYTAKYAANNGALVWERRHDGPLHAADGAVALALDTQGNALVTGYSVGTTGNEDFLTVKYAASNGALQWERRYNGIIDRDERPSVITTDNTGIYVAGMTVESRFRPTFTIIKYSNAGVPAWTNSNFHSLGIGSAAIQVERTNGTGNIYIVGSGSGLTFNTYSTVVAYNANGGIAWTDSLSAGLEIATDGATSVGVDGSGNVYVAGYTVGSPPSNDYALYKYSRTGTSLWRKQFDGPGTLSDRVAAIAVDASGNAYLTGSDVGTEGSSDYATIRVSPAGSGVWTNRYNSLNKNMTEGMAAAFDAGGNLYVTGSSRLSLSGQFLTLKYDRRGAPEWTNYFQVPGNDFPRPYEIVVDAEGGVVVGGNINRDIALIAYAPTGVARWTNYFGAQFGGDDSLRDMAAGPEGNVYVTGSSFGELYDYATVAYSGGGVALWTNRFDGVEHGNDNPAALAVGISGNVYVTGASRELSGRTVMATLGYSSAGAPLWTNIFRDVSNQRSYLASELTVDRDGNVTVAGYSTATASLAPQLVVLRFTANGNLASMWMNELPADLDGSTMAFDSLGDLYITGPRGTPADFYTAKYASTNGTLCWEHRYDGPQHLQDYPQALAIASGRVLITGSSWNGAENDCQTVAYAAIDGRPLWDMRYDGELQADDRTLTPRSLAVGPGGLLAVAGVSDGSVNPSSPTYEFLTIRYASSFSLAPGERTHDVLETSDERDGARMAGLYYADRYQLILSNAPPGGEYAVYARAPFGFEPDLELLNEMGQAVPSVPPVSPDFEREALLLLVQSPGQRYSVQISSVATNQTGPYDVGLFPVLRDCSSIGGTLGPANRRDSFRTNATYYANDYLLQTAQPIIQAAVRTTNFTPRLWFWNLSAGETEGDAFRGDGFQANGVISNATSRLWMVRVSSEETNVSGYYELTIDGGAGVTSFTPKLGAPGQEVRIGTVQLDVANALTGVSFGGAIDTSAFFDMGTGEVIAHVPVAARSGRILVQAENCSAVSLAEFVVVSPVRNIRHDVGAGQLTFEASNTVAGVQAVVEGTTNLNAPIMWQPLWTNAAVGPGVWRYTNQIRAVPPQQFLRVKVP